jgi:hypothetical protein
VEDGILTFTGDGLISVKPTSLNGGTLHIEDSEGNSYIYELGVVKQHTCTAGDREIIIQPMDSYDGFAVRRCVVCSDIMEVEPLTADDLCDEHQFSEWETELEATHQVSGMQRRTCIICGAEEISFTDKKPYESSELPITSAESTATSETASLANQSGEPISALVILAAYNTDGKMIGVRTKQMEMTAQETQTLTVEWEGNQSIGRITAFLVDPVTYTPLCNAQNLRESTND